MFWNRALMLFVFSCLYFTVFSQPFQCDGRLILSTVTSNTTVYNISFGPFGAIYYNPMPTYQDVRFDALGFNPKDNYIYGVKENTNSIIRLSSNGSYEVVGSVNQVNSLNAYAGDCSPEGLYLCHDNELDKILVFNVLNNFELVNQLDLFWDPTSQNSGPFTTRIDDFVIDPNNPNIAYTFQGHYNEDDFEPAATRGFLLKINLDFSDSNVGMVTPIAAIPSDIVLQLGSLFFTKEGQLFGLGPYTNMPFITNRLISINPFSGEALIQGITAPVASITDGCSCPYSLSFENDIVPRNTTCSNSALDFVLTINNRSNEELSDLILTDTLPEGMIIQEISGNFNGNIVGGTGVNTRILAIDNFYIPPKGIVVININAGVIDIPVGNISNQAHLTNLPSLFGGVKHSDDPQTTGFVGDNSKFLVVAQPIENVAIEVILPSNCLDANDAQILISSPILLAGENYEVKLLNQSWEEFYYDVVVDGDNSFVLDSLVPGEYQLAQVRPENSRCSFVWKDTTIVIDPPNDQLQVTAESNSPICEGISLQLNGTISPDGNVTWTGPQSFFSSDLSPQIDAATPEYNGTFEMIATYGACEQIRTVDVFVAPEIQASINGKLEYCERENMQLEAEGNGDLRAFKWSGPENLESDSQQINVLSMAPNNEGLYEVIIDNGYCMDTANTVVSVLPSPTISLTDLIETDFCETVKLSPEITGDNDVVYSWTPSEGLSCSDCLTPELLVPFLPSYRLTVINESLCTDTSVVKISLLKENLIYVPNAFSPNFDGFNDYFQMFPGCGVSSIKNLEIFNRWGAIVYSKDVIDHHDPQEFWNGLIRNKIGASGVYIWQVEIELVDGTNLRLFGDISLLR